jgi:hypothetical protein
MESYEEFLLNFFDEKPIVKKSNCCTEKDEKIIDGFLTCINCGVIADCPMLVADKYDDHMHRILYMPYKRVIYFKQKIQLLAGCCFYTPNAKLLFLINNIKKSKKRLSLNKIKTLLKLNNLNKYYKYIYSIYNDIYGEPLIKISCSVVSQMLFKFLEIERFFKKNIKRKNMLSYNIILYYLLKQYNIKNYDRIILPFNATKIKKIFKRYDLFN